jgi:hypoxanthine phosphoribosyltransferase
MKENISVLIPEERIVERTEQIAAELSKKYSAIDDGKPIVVVGILKGSVMFMVELIKRMNIPVELDFMVVSSYGDSTNSSGQLKIKKDLDNSVADKHVLLVEDIVDSGRTLHHLLDYLKGKSPASLTLCTLLDKPSRREFEVDVEYVGFEIPDEFVVGYGLDYAQRYRNLPYIGVISFEEE